MNHAVNILQKAFESNKLAEVVKQQLSVHSTSQHQIFAINQLIKYIFISHKIAFKDQPYFILSLFHQLFSTARFQIAYDITTHSGLYNWICTQITSLITGKESIDINKPINRTLINLVNSILKAFTFEFSRDTDLFSCLYSIYKPTFEAIVNAIYSQNISNLINNETYISFTINFLSSYYDTLIHLKKTYKEQLYTIIDTIVWMDTTVLLTRLIVSLSDVIASHQDDDIDEDTMDDNNSLAHSNVYNNILIKAMKISLLLIETLLIIPLQSTQQEPFLNSASGEKRTHLVEVLYKLPSSIHKLIVHSSLIHGKKLFAYIIITYYYYILTSILTI